MPNLDFKVESVESLPFSVSPHVVFKIVVANDEDAETIQNVMLKCQIQIETVRRGYSDVQKAKLFELYGEPERWGQTLQTLLWTHASVAIPPFTGNTTVDLPVACSFDFNLAVTKYFDAIDDGEIPLCLLFSGTIFYHDSAGSLQISQISWEKEANFRLSVSVWKEMMEHYYPNSAWLNIRKDVFEKLQEYKMRRSIPSWEQTFERLLPADEEIEVRSGTA